MKRSPVLRQVVLCCILVAVAVAGWIVFVPSARETLARTGVFDALGIELAVEEDAADGPPGGGFGGGATRVITRDVEDAVMNDRISMIGDGRAVRAIDVRSDVTGLVTEVGIDPGDRVEAGDTLVRLDDRAEQIALERARIGLDDARDQVERNERLQSTGAVTAVSLQAAEVALRSAELELRQAELDLEEREITAPIAGWIGIPEIDVGDRIAAQEALVTITDRSEILVDFRVPERVIGQIEVGMPFEAEPLARPDLSLTGEIDALDSTVDRASRTLRVQGRLDNSEDLLRAGMAFTIRLELPGDSYPAVDPLALQWSSEGSYVWAVEDGRAVRVPVVIRQRNADAVLVEADLAPGDAVVTEGLQSLRAGAEVDVVTPEPQAAAARRSDADAPADEET